jgi:hypothetical protein
MNVIGRWLLLLIAVISLGIAPIVAQATSLPVPPQIQIIATDAATAAINFLPSYRWRPDGREIQFGASVGPTGLFVDVYFGVIVPGGRTFTWTAGSAMGPILVEGLHPAAQNLDRAATFNSSASLGGTPRYAFSNGDPLGLYTLFVLVVPHGADPSDTPRWIAVSMSPLFVSDCAPDPVLGYCR